MMAMAVMMSFTRASSFVLVGGGHAVGEPFGVALGMALVAAGLDALPVDPAGVPAAVLVGACRVVVPLAVVGLRAGPLAPGLGRLGAFLRPLPLAEVRSLRAGVREEVRDVLVAGRAAEPQARLDPVA